MDFPRIVLCFLALLTMVLGGWAGWRGSRMSWWFVVAGLGFLITGLTTPDASVAHWLGWGIQMIGLVGAIIVGLRERARRHAP